jgi:hypothetical protein
MALACGIDMNLMAAVDALHFVVCCEIILTCVSGRISGEVAHVQMLAWPMLAYNGLCLVS